MKRQSNITREMNKLSISQMQDPRTVGDFIYILYEGTTKAAFNEFDLYFSDVDAAYPNVCVSLAGIVDYYKEIKGTKFNFVNMQDYLNKTFIDSPQSPESCNDNTSLLSKIWIFKKSEDIQWLVDDNFIGEVS